MAAESKSRPARRRAAWPLAGALLLALLAVLQFPQTPTTDALAQVLIAGISALLPTILATIAKVDWTARSRMFFGLFVLMTVGAALTPSLFPALAPSLRTSIQAMLGRTELRLTLRELRVTACSQCSESKSTHFNFGVNATSNLGSVSIGGRLSRDFVRLQEASRKVEQTYPVNLTVVLTPDDEAKFLTVSIGIFSNSELFATEPRWVSVVVEKVAFRKWVLKDHPSEAPVFSDPIEGFWNGEPRWVGVLVYELE